MNEDKEAYRIEKARDGGWWVNKGIFSLCWTRTEDQAKFIVNALDFALHGLKTEVSGDSR